ncbi:MAG: hypothetical protein ACAH95_11975 [Fimbriimonas sp.]
MASDSSLDRFLKNRAAIGLGLVNKRITFIQSAMGGLLSLVGSAGIMATVGGASRDTVPAMTLMLAAGAVMFTTSVVVRRMFRSMGSVDWRLSPEAKGLLLKLVRRRLGWLEGGGFAMSSRGMGLGFGMGKHTRRTLRRIAWDNGESSFRMLSRPAPEVSPEVIAFLDVAAEQYNRISGIVQSPALAGTLSKLGPTAIAAADEAMADILHQSATLDKFPESVNATRKQIDTAIRALIELGDRLEEVATRDQLLTERLDYSSKMDSVLEELRLDQLARSELQTPPAEENQQLEH